jgi:ribosome-binding factor A
VYVKDAKTGEQIQTFALHGAEKRIWVAYDEQKAKATFDGICLASSEIRRELSHLTNIRYVPELRFYSDGASAYGNKIDKILANLTYGENNDDSGNQN